MAGPLADHVREGIVEELALAVSTHHRHRLPAGFRLAGGNLRRRKAGTRICLALQLQRRDGLDPSTASLTSQQRPVT